jgi:hypothetical protein
MLGSVCFYDDKIKLVERESLKYEMGNLEDLEDLNIQVMMTELPEE